MQTCFYEQNFPQFSCETTIEWSLTYLRENKWNAACSHGGEPLVGPGLVTRLYTVYRESESIHTNNEKMEYA